jgi:hypothetical protein
MKLPAALAAVVALVLAHAPNADARKLQMSGTWAMRRGGVFVPLQFAMTKGGSQMTATSQGELSQGFLFPHGPVLGQGGVSATGSAPATLRIPPHRFGGEFDAAIPLAGITLIQLTTMHVADGPAVTATLAPGGGPGSFTWCPGDPACVAGGGMLPTDPPQGAGSHNGRIIYRAGANQFGGAIQMLLGGGGVASTLYGPGPPGKLLVKHLYFGPHALPQPQHTGASYAFTNRYTPPSGFVTLAAVPTQGLILYPGPRLTTMGGFSDTAMGPTLFLPGTPTSNTGFPATTGTVIAQQTTGTAGDSFFTVMGSDLRSPLGAGNISLVSGGLSVRRTVGSHTRSASFGRIWMTLAPPVPTLSPAGAAAAGALLLLAAGYARRRRIGR